jgi:hypothetical protein
MEGFSVSGTSRIVPKRSSLLVYSANQSNLAEVFLYDAPVNNRLQVRFADFLDLTGLAASGPQDGIASAFDPFSLFVAVGVLGEVLQIIRLDPTGQLSLTNQSFTGQITGPGRPSTDATGRLVAFNQLGGHDVGLGHFVGDGQSTFEVLDLFDIPGLTGFATITALHPSGRWVFVDGWSVEIDPASGQFVGVVGDKVDAGGTSAAVSPDGRFVLTGAGARLVRFNDDGSLTLLNTGVPGVPSLSDIAFIPPRAQPTLPGDANVDGLVDVADMVFLIEKALPDDALILPPQSFANADIDQDVDVDQDDFNALLDLILALP